MNVISQSGSRNRGTHLPQLSLEKERSGDPKGRYCANLGHYPDSLRSFPFGGISAEATNCLNRMNTLTNSSGTWDYLYRADGPDSAMPYCPPLCVGGISAIHGSDMRVSKTNGSSTTLYRYDGQMAMEDVDLGTNPAVTDYAIGARGIDAISKTVGSNTVVVYPIYDAHGNPDSLRSFPFGGISAIHGSDTTDESGLVYMRARYYEPTSGRFISEDKSGQGDNWFVYCKCNPICSIDESGKSQEDERLMLLGAIWKLVGMFFMGGGFCLEFCSFPAAFSQMLELGNEYQVCMQLVKEFGAQPSGWEAFRDQAQFLIDAFSSKINFNGVRSALGGAILALEGYMMICEGELMQQDAGD